MFNQRGQIHVLVLILIVVGFVLYANFSDKSFLGLLFPSSTAKPASGGGRISAPSAPNTPGVPVQQLTAAPEPPDTTPPQRFNPQPTGNLPTETRRITMGLETNEKATCKYSSETSGIYYDSMQGKFDQASSASHSVSIATLSEGGQYKYYVKCSDEKGNKNSDDFIISFGVKLPEDKTPPVLRNPSHQGDIFPVGTREAVISISTDEPASCWYSGSMSGNFSYYDQTKKFHVRTVSGLENGKSYDFLVRCRDFAGNANTGDVLISFKVAQ